MIEFIYNTEKKQWGIIEINGRPWLMIDFFRRLGFSFLKLLVNDISGLNFYSLLNNYKKKKLNSIKNKSTFRLIINNRIFSIYKLQKIIFLKLKIF